MRLMFSSFVRVLAFTSLVATSAVAAPDLKLADCITNDGKTAIQIYSDASQVLFWLDVNTRPELDYSGHLVPKNSAGGFDELTEWLAVVGIDRTLTEHMIVLRTDDETKSEAPMYMAAQGYDGASLGVIIARPRALPELCVPVKK